MKGASRWRSGALFALALIGLIVGVACGTGGGGAQTPTPKAGAALATTPAASPTPEANLATLSLEAPIAPGPATKEFTVSSDSQNPVQAVKIKGAVTNPTITIGSNTVTLPVELAARDEINVTFNPNSTVSRTRLAESFTTEAQEYKNIIFKEGVGQTLRWMELENLLGDYETQYEGYVIYKITSPYSMTGLTVASYPQLYNDKEKKNSVSMLYSADGTNYTSVYKLASNGSAVDVTTEAKSNTIAVSGTTVYLKFLFQGHGNPEATEHPTTVQLWSIADKPMTFTAKFDSSALSKLALQSGSNTVKFSAEKAQGKVDLTLMTTGAASKR